MNPPLAFNLKQARILAEASAEAYRAGGRSYPIHSLETDTHALIIGTEDDVIVAFRGTADRRNWLTNLDCHLLNVGPFRIHRGFYCAYESVIGEILEVVHEMRRSRIWITGHSLGGALAMLCARHFRGGLAGVYTFGQPRVGDGDFRDNYNFFFGGLTYRIVHADDVVPRVPWQMGRYRHAGQEVFFPARRNAPPLLNPTLARKAASDGYGLARAIWHGRDALLGDHHLDNYLTILGSRSEDLEGVLEL